MEQKPPSLVVFDYNHGGRVLLTARRKYAFVAALFVALAIARLFPIYGLVALIVPALVYLRGKRILSIGPRYLICGDRIVYYANVKNLSFSEQDASICLRTGLKTQLTIEEKRFRANTRSPDEKVARFAQAVQLITAQVHRFAPEAIRAPDAAEATGESAESSAESADADGKPPETVEERAEERTAE